MSKKKKRNIDKLYEENKLSSIGNSIHCPICNKEFAKVTKQQAFCCTTCKDKYWNTKRKRNGYFHKYNAEHPERLERGYTKGYVDGCVSKGAMFKQRFNSLPLEVSIFNHLSVWHDDDWCEGTNDD